MLAEVLLCLALNGYHEARGEAFHGQIAVNQVAIRRAEFDPERVCYEIYRPDQFSWTKAFPRGSKLPPPGPEWDQAKASAQVALLWAYGGTTIPDYSNGADHYHSTRVRPSWTQCAALTVQIDRHKFWKNVKPCLPVSKR